MLCLIIGIWIFGMIMVGLFLQLNYDLEFFEYRRLEYLSMDDEPFWWVVIFWPIAIPGAIILLGVSVWYKILYKWIEEMQNKKEDG